jgi:hypothetical protein
MADDQRMRCQTRLFYDPLISSLQNIAVNSQSVTDIQVVDLTPFVARFVRLIPTLCVTTADLIFELYGCPNGQ